MQILSNNSNNYDNAYTECLFGICARHGARTPLTAQYWGPAQWDAHGANALCGTLPGTVHLSITDVSGGPRPECEGDITQARLQCVDKHRATRIHPGPAAAVLCLVVTFLSLVYRGQLCTLAVSALVQAASCLPPFLLCSTKPKSVHAQAKTVLPGGCTRGELTMSGQSQARALGAWLRRRYVDGAGFLPPDYEDGVVAARTTNYRYALQTLHGTLFEGGQWKHEWPK